MFLVMCCTYLPVLGMDSQAEETAPKNEVIATLTYTESPRSRAWKLLPSQDSLGVWRLPMKGYLTDKEGNYLDCVIRVEERSDKCVVTALHTAAKKAELLKKRAEKKVDNEATAS